MGDAYQAMRYGEMALVPGVEYLSLIKSDLRAQACQVLGFSPSFMALRSYVRVSGGSVLDPVSCSQLSLVIVADERLGITSLCERDALTAWYRWIHLFMDDWSSMSDDELCAMDMRVGKIVGQTSSVGSVASEVDYENVTKEDCEVRQYVELRNQENGHADEGVVDYVQKTAVRFRLNVDDVHSQIHRQSSKSVTYGVDTERGYCYLKLFPSSVVSEVAALLGATPLLTDVVDLMLMVRHLDGYHYDLGGVRLVIQPVMVHVAGGAMRIDEVLLRFLQLYKHGFTGRIGAITDVELDIGDAVFVRSCSCNRGHMHAIGCCYASECNLCLATVESHVYACKNSGKLKCTVCNYWVVPEGHEGRCHVPNASGCDTKQLEILKRRAWIGDSRHTSDVRQLLLAKGVEPSSWQSVAETYVSRAHQAEWYRNYAGAGIKMHSLSNTEKACSQAFEASYVGLFRRDYCDYLMAEVGLSTVSGIGDVDDQVEDDTSLFSGFANT